MNNDAVLVFILFALATVVESHQPWVFGKEFAKKKARANRSENFLTTRQ